MHVDDAVTGKVWPCHEGMFGSQLVLQSSLLSDTSRRRFSAYIRKSVTVPNAFW